MSSIFNATSKEEIVKRIHSLQPNNPAAWGKMNAYQMMKHCTLCDDMFNGEINVKRVFIGRLLGRILLKQALKEGKPFDKNAPTSPLLKAATDSGDFDALRNEWLGRLDKYDGFSNRDFVHPFFGKMTTEQVGIFVYKHADHHLRQFGV